MSFHAPEGARVVDHPHQGLRSSAADGNNGLFEMASPEPGWRLWVICSDGSDQEREVAAAFGTWEHVSVHAYKPLSLQQSRVADRRALLGRTQPATPKRTPTWREMCFVKAMFWGPEDAVVQYHPRHSQYVNEHPYTLHLWRPVDRPLPEPPAVLVGRLPEERDDD